jgi:D-glycero-alpha-D-manno-heptose 1-phosphate guanylyltransferase
MMHDTKAILLVGGMGTRLRAVVPSAPKPLARVGDRPFLELLVRQLANQGVRHLVMSTGYLADQIESEFGDGRGLDVKIEYSREPQPLGTAGAVKFAEAFVKDAPEFVVMNGDSFMEVDFSELLRFHRSHNAVVSMAVRRVENAQRYGTVEMNAEGRVTGFAEKAAVERPGVVNAGIYVFNREVLDAIPQGPSSLEKDVFPRMLERGVFALQQQGMFIDIGTPEDYARAQVIFDGLSEAALRK